MKVHTWSKLAFEHGCLVYLLYLCSIQEGSKLLRMRSKCSVSQNILRQSTLLLLSSF